MSSIVVRRPPRSKGCKQCISRRVKCDERAGCCIQCARFGLPCSGAIRGAVFLDMTEKVSYSRLKPKKKRGKKTPSSQKDTEDLASESVAGDEVAACDVSTEEKSCPITSLPSCSRMAENENTSSRVRLFGDGYNHSDMVLRPSPKIPLSSSDGQFADSNVNDYDASIPSALDTSAYDEYCFVGNFTKLLTSSRRNYSARRPESWISKLPYLVATNSLPSPLKFALRAVALSYHAVTHDSRAELPAIKFYLVGMQSYRSIVLGGQAKQSSMTPTSKSDVDTETLHTSDIVAICGPVLFSFYEALQEGGSDAELLHHSAAMQMFQARGPDKCTDGLAHSVMRSMRVKEAFLSIMHNRSANFSSPEWLSVPFRQKHKICYDKLTDILLSFTMTLRLPNMNQRGADLKSSILRIHDLSTACKTNIEERVRMLQKQLQHWCLEFRDEHCEIIAQDSVTSSAIDTAYTAADSPCFVLPLSGPWMIANNETLASSMIAIYCGINIILHSILFMISLSKPPSSIETGYPSAVDAHRAAISTYAASVFNAASCINMVNPFCGDALRTKFSMKIVSQFALEDSQRDEAQRMLGQWKLRDKALPR